MNSAVRDDDGVGLAAYVGEEVVVYGTPAVNDGSALPVLNVTRVEPADGPPPGLPSATLTFELAVEGEPPEDAFFLGLILAEGLGRVPLTDPDGDGLYTGSATFPKFPPGPLPVPPGIEPVSLPIQIVQGPPTGATALGPEFRVIKDFGEVLLDEDKTLSASVSFEDGEEPPDGVEEISVTGVVENLGGSGALPPYGLRDEATGGVYYLASDEVDFAALAGQRITAFGTPEEVLRSVVLNVTRIKPADGSGNNGDSDGGGSGGSSGGGSSGGGSGNSGSGSGGISGLLPSTGGITPYVLGAGALLVIGGLLVRRIFR